MPQEANLHDMRRGASNNRSRLKDTISGTTEFSESRPKFKLPKKEGNRACESNLAGETMVGMQVEMAFRI